MSNACLQNFTAIVIQLALHSCLYRIARLKLVFSLTKYKNGCQIQAVWEFIALLLLLLIEYLRNILLYFNATNF